MKVQSKLGVTIPVPYKVYTALLTQTGTTDPVATVLENTLGFNINITRTAGIPYVYYSFTADGDTFDLTKTTFELENLRTSGNSLGLYKRVSSHPNTEIRINPVVQTASTQTFEDWDAITTAKVEIIVYP